MGKLRLYFEYFKNKFFKRIKRVKREKPAIDFEEVKEEVWTADFSGKTDPRFKEEQDSGYKTFFEKQETGGSFCLELLRKHIYAWSLNPQFRYKNFVLEAALTIPPHKTGLDFAEADKGAGAYAAGFLFRYIAEKAFYAVLISDKGWVRMDAVINSTPIPMLGWTRPLEKIENGSFSLKLICVDTSFTVMVNNVWLAKISNDIIQSAGKIAFAGQNWETVSAVKFTLRNFSIKSDNLIAEAADSAANEKKSISPEARINLAQTYYAMGQVPSAIYEIKKAWELRCPVYEDYLLAGRIYFSRRMVEEAEDSFLKALQLNGDSTELSAEIAGLYYHCDNYEKLGSFLKKIPAAEIRASAVLCNFKGHYLHFKGEYEKAAGFYAQAAKLNPGQGVFRLNEANEYVNAGKKEKAVETYIEAANIFLSGEEYNDLGTVINSLERLAPEDERVLALNGKFYYAVENYEAALENFTKLCSAGTKDSTAWYLFALLLQKKGETEKSVKALKKACKLEPDYALYHFRLAEILFLTGQDCAPFLEQALNLDEKNGWTHNLNAMYLMSLNDLEAAEKAVLNARKLLPGEMPVLENYTEIKRLRGKLKDCEPLFDIEAGTADLAAERNTARAYHIFANALYADGKNDEACGWYEKALKLSPSDSEILVDKAENSLQIGLLNEADGLLVKALDIKPSEKIYRLISTAAAKKGDYARSEISLIKAAEDFGESADILFDLTNLYLTLNKKDKAERTFVKLKEKEKSARIQKLEALF